MNGKLMSMMEDEGAWRMIDAGSRTIARKYPRGTAEIRFYPSENLHRMILMSDGRCVFCQDLDTVRLREVSRRLYDRVIARDMAANLDMFLQCE